MKAVFVAICLGLAGMLALPPGPARAQETRETIALQNQILELRQEVQQLRDQVARLQAGGGSSLGGYQQPAPAPDTTAQPPDLMAQVLSRVQQLEEQVRTLRGRIDEVDNARQRDSDNLAKQIGDLNFKIDNGGAAAPGAPPGAPGPRPATMSPPPGNLGAVPAGGGDMPPPPPPPPVKRTPEMILQEGNAALARKEFLIAEAAAKAALADGGPRATDAQFLLARALYGARDFSGAAVAFDETYKRSKTGTHAPDALLGLADALTAIQEKKAACQTLEKLAAEFPALRQDLKVRAAVARRDAACH